jgi:hypothetical protein
MSVKYSYVLKIDCNENSPEVITSLLDIAPTISNDNRWELEIIQDENGNYVDFIQIFVNILKDKYIKLEEIGIKRDSISIWIYYEYDQQCNMEFSPDNLSKIGNNGISLCISCWQH